MRDLPEPLPATHHNSSQRFLGTCLSPAMMWKVLHSCLLSGSAKADLRTHCHVCQLSAGPKAAPSKLESWIALSMLNKPHHIQSSSLSVLAVSVLPIVSYKSQGLAS